MTNHQWIHWEAQGKGSHTKQRAVSDQSFLPGGTFPPMTEDKRGGLALAHPETKAESNRKLDTKLAPGLQPAWANTEKDERGLY